MGDRPRWPRAPGDLTRRAASAAAGSAVLVGSYGLWLAFAWVNRRLPASWLVMAGLVLNILVIGVNGGMPVSASALETAGARTEGLHRRGHREAPPDGPADVADAAGRRDRDPAADRRRGLDRRRAPVRGGRGRGDGHARTVGRESPAAGSDFQGYRGKHLPADVCSSVRRLDRGRSGSSACSDGSAGGRLEQRGRESDRDRRSLTGALSTSKRPPPTWARSRIMAMPK